MAHEHPKKQIKKINDFEIMRCTMKMSEKRSEKPRREECDDRELETINNHRPESGHC